MHGMRIKSHKNNYFKNNLPQRNDAPRFWQRPQIQPPAPETAQGKPAIAKKLALVTRAAPLKRAEAPAKTSRPKPTSRAAPSRARKTTRR